MIDRGKLPGSGIQLALLVIWLVGLDVPPALHAQEKPAREKPSATATKEPIENKPPQEKPPSSATAPQDPTEKRLFALEQLLGQVRLRLDTPRPSDLPEGTKKQLTDIHQLLKETREAILSRPGARPQDFADVQGRLDAIARKVEPGIFDEIWKSYVSNVIWEFFGIKRGGGAGGANLLGMIFSTVGLALGLYLTYLKIHFWRRKIVGLHGGDRGDRFEGNVHDFLFNIFWFVFAIPLALGFFSLTWVSKKVSLPPAAVELHQDVTKAAARLKGLEEVPPMLQRIDGRLAHLESRQGVETGPVTKRLDQMKLTLDQIRQDISGLQSGTLAWAFWGVLSWVVTIIVVITGCLISRIIYDHL